MSAAWKIEGMTVCTATHPKMPNYSGHSRGRKTHLTKDGKKTVCNMLVDIYVPNNDRNWSYVWNGFCQTCFHGIKKPTREEILEHASRQH